MTRRFLVALGATVLTFVFAGGASATIPPVPAGDEGPAQEQHGGAGGHLPASSDNVQLLGKLRLATQPGGISDVAALGNFAYVNAWAPECRELGGGGTGVHVVDISNPAAPVEVAFLESPNNAYVSEGVHAFHAETPFFSGDLLIHENEPCDSAQPAQLGISIWDVTNPSAPVPLARHFGDNVPAGSPGINGIHHYHSVEGWWVPETGKAFAVASDNQDLDDIDIFDITDPRKPVQVADFGFNDFPAVARTPLAYGENVFFHDSDVKKIGSNWVLLTHYWDAGTQQWNVNDPANPTLISDFDYKRPDPVSRQKNPEGNGHSGEFTADGKYFILNDEDFSPTRANCSIGSTAIGCAEFGWDQLVPLAEAFPGGFSGSPVFGGSGCEEDFLPANGTSDRAEVPPATGPGQAVAFLRGVCFFSVKVESGILAGYDMVIIINSHAGSQAGLTPNSFFAGGQGSAIPAEEASAVMIGHANGHELFNDPVTFTPTADLPALGTAGKVFGAEGGVFDAWGYNHLIDRVTGKEVGQYIVDEANDPAFASGFGTLSVHEVATDKVTNLAYFSYYDAGFRVARFGPSGLKEVGHFIDTGGNDFWGVEVTGVTSNGRPVIALSDRDFGLYLFSYTGG